jgi:hypothetical protein
MESMVSVAAEDGVDQVLLFVVDILNEEATLLVPNDLVKGRGRKKLWRDRDRRQGGPARGHEPQEADHSEPQGLSRAQPAGAQRRAPDGKRPAAPRAARTGRRADDPVDLWGCVHDGVQAIPSAIAALQTYRAGGGTVILVTNSPRPRAGVEAQIRNDFGVPDDAWDAVATSGDSARSPRCIAASSGARSGSWASGRATRISLNRCKSSTIRSRSPACRWTRPRASSVAGRSTRWPTPTVNRPEFLYAKQRV